MPAVPVVRQRPAWNERGRQPLAGIGLYHPAGEAPRSESYDLVPVRLTTADSDGSWPFTFRVPG